MNNKREKQNAESAVSQLKSLVSKSKDSTKLTANALLESLAEKHNEYRQAIIECGQLLSAIDTDVAGLKRDCADWTMTVGEIAHQMKLSEDDISCLANMRVLERQGSAQSDRMYGWSVYRFVRFVYTYVSSDDKRREDATESLLNN